MVVSQLWVTLAPVYQEGVPVYFRFEVLVDDVVSDDLKEEDYSLERSHHVNLTSRRSVRVVKVFLDLLHDRFSETEMPCESNPQSQGCSVNHLGPGVRTDNQAGETHGDKVYCGNLDQYDILEKLAKRVAIKVLSEFASETSAEYRRNECVAAGHAE